MRFGLLAIALSILGSATAIGQEKVYRPEKGIRLPLVVKQVPPVYTPEARAAGIEGSVLVTAAVSSKGTVGEVEVLQSLDTKYGLDQRAIDAARQWLFKPGTKDGMPVAVLVTIELTFSLKNTK